MKRLNLQLSDHIHGELSEAAHRCGMTAPEWVRMAIARELGLAPGAKSAVARSQTPAGRKPDDTAVEHAKRLGHERSVPPDLQWYAEGANRVLAGEDLPPDDPAYYGVIELLAYRLAECEIELSALPEHLHQPVGTRAQEILLTEDER